MTRKGHSMHRSLSTSMLCCLGATLALGTMTSDAHAQPSAEQKARADALYNEGAKFFVEKKYSEAILRFKNSHKIDSSPKTLYNIALCYGRLGEFSEAVDFAKRASKSKKAPQDLKRKATARLRGFSTALQATRVARDIESPAVVKVVPPKGVDTPEQGSGFGLLGWSGVGVGVVGVGLMGGALLVSGGLGEEIDAYEEDARNDPNPPRDSTRFDDITNTQTTGKVLLFSGAGLATAGVVMILIDVLSDSDSQATQATVTPLLAPSRGGAWAGVQLGF